MSNKGFYENLNEKLTFFQLFTVKEDHHPAHVEQLISDYKTSKEVAEHYDLLKSKMLSDEDKAMLSLSAKGAAIKNYSNDIGKLLEQGPSKLVLGFANSSPYVAFDHSLDITDSELVLVMHKNNIISPLEFAKEKYADPVMKILGNQYHLAEHHLPEDFKTSVDNSTVQKFVKSYFVNSAVLNNQSKF